MNVLRLVIIEKCEVKNIEIGQMVTMAARVDIFKRIISHDPTTAGISVSQVRLGRQVTGKQLSVTTHRTQTQTQTYTLHSGFQATSRGGRWSWTFKLAQKRS